MENLTYVGLTNAVKLTKDSAGYRWFYQKKLFLQVTTGNLNLSFEVERHRNESSTKVSLLYSSGCTNSALKVVSC